MLVNPMLWYTIASPKKKMTLHAKMKEQLLKRIKAVLASAYGDRLSAVILFGSVARGDEGEESDMDLFVLFKDSVSLAVDLKALIRLLYPIQKELNHPIHPIPINEHLFYSGQFRIFKKAQMEGVVL